MSAPHLRYTLAEAKAALEAMRSLALATHQTSVTRAAAILLSEIKRMHWQLECADEVFEILLKDDQVLPFLPLEGHDEWTDWITTALKNAGFWQLMRARQGTPE
jgi:hypothetical protein